jgi:hypothetical protein
MKTPPRNSTHQVFPTIPTLHLNSLKKNSFDFIDFFNEKTVKYSMAFVSQF